MNNLSDFLKNHVFVIKMPLSLPYKGEINNMDIDLYQLLSETTMPSHWPQTSCYRLISIKTKILRKVRGIVIPVREVSGIIKKVIKDAFPVDSYSSKTITTYQSVLIRYVAEKIKGEKLQPWEATKYFKRIKK